MFIIIVYRQKNNHTPTLKLTPFNLFFTEYEIKNNIVFRLDRNLLVLKK